MKKIFSFSLILILLLCVLAPITCSAEQSEYGNITTSFDETTGTLTVSGFGKVQKLYYDEKNVDNKIKHLVIGKGITAIHSSFNGLNALEDITFPPYLKRIDFSFSECNNLESVNIPDTISHLVFSFSICNKLKDVTLNKKVDLVGCFSSIPIEEIFIPHGSSVTDSFNGCKNLTKVILDQDVVVRGTEEISDDETNYHRSFDNCNAELVIYAATTRDDKNTAIQTPLDTTLPPILLVPPEELYEYDSFPENETTDEELAEQQALHDKQELKLMTNSLNIVLICLISSEAFNAVLLIVLVVKRRKKHIATEA